MKTAKQFNLTKEEKDLLVNQANLRSQHEYLASLIERDSFLYLNREVRKRLAIGNEFYLKSDLVKGIVSVIPVKQPAEKEIAKK